MNSKVNITKLDGPAGAVEFRTLKPGDWYESGSCYELCMKLSSISFWCFHQQKVIEFASASWPCRVVNVSIKYKVA